MVAIFFVYIHSNIQTAAQDKAAFRRTHARMHARTQRHDEKNIYIIYAQQKALLVLDVYENTHMHKYIHTRARAHTHTHTHTRVHTHDAYTAQGAARRKCLRYTYIRDPYAAKEQLP
jgi:hypothetical protein